MKGNLTPIVLGILAALLIVAVLTERRLPLIGNPRIALAILLVLGAAMCTSGGIGRVADQGTWAQPLPIVAYLLGALAVVAGVAGLAGWRLPLANDARQAFIAVGGIGVLKVLVTMVDRLV